MLNQLDYTVFLDVFELERFPYPWPTPDMKIYKSYFPCGYEEAIKDTPVKHGIFVQCLNGSVDEASKFFFQNLQKVIASFQNINFATKYSKCQTIRISDEAQYF